MESPFLHDWVRVHARVRPDAPAIETPRVLLRYGDLSERIDALAARLAEGGVEPGARVLIALPNVPATVVTSLAVQSLGAVPVEVNREWTVDTIADVAGRTASRDAVVWWRDVPVWDAVPPERRPERLWVVEPSGAAVRAGSPLRPFGRIQDDGRVEPGPARSSPVPGPGREERDPALILFTSGSTGRPRGVVQTHRNVDANTRSIVEYLELTERDRAHLVLPLHYCYGRSVLQTHLHVGGSVFLEDRMAFPRVVLEALSSGGATGFAGVPLTFELIRRHADPLPFPLPCLRYLTQAGGAMAPETIEWVRRAFRPARLFVMYGQTEATARLSYLPPQHAESKRGSIGVPIPGVELQVVDDDGRELRDGEVGNLVARGDNVTPGYLDEPTETAAILRQGWLWTGDLARRDPDGFFFHEGRSRDILKIGGHRVSPVEIEHVLQQHGDVAEAGVVGEPHPLLGEVPVVFLVARPGRNPDPEDLRRFCRERMPAYQVPARFERTTALPRSAAGKLLRASLVERCAAASAGSRDPSPTE